MPESEIMGATRDILAVRARLGVPRTPRAHVRIDLVRPNHSALRRPIATPASVMLPAPKREPMTIMSPLTLHGWPVYVRPVFYDHFDGQLTKLPVPTWKSIAREVCEKYEVTLLELQSARRDQRVVPARFEAFWRCKNETTMSLPAIGRRFGNRDHTTVLHGIKQHEKRMREAGSE